MAHIVATQDDLKEVGSAKTALRSATAAASVAKIWRFAGQFATGAAVASYLNLPPVQVAGEAMVTGPINGPFDVWIFL
jgi:hypothetical protein